MMWRDGLIIVKKSSNYNGMISIFIKRKNFHAYMHEKIRGGNNPTYSLQCAVVGIFIFFFVVIVVF